MVNKLSAEYLFYNNESPVQWGTVSQIHNYIKKHSNNQNLKSNLQTLKDFKREINLGTHTNKNLKDIGSYHRNIIPKRNGSFQADLVDILGSNKTNKHALKVNDGFVWMLLVINTQTKKVYFRKMKKKTAEETSKNLESIFKDDVGLSKNDEFTVLLQTDKGTEFFNNPVKKVLNNLNVRLYASYSRHKANIVERVILTLRRPLVKAMESKGFKWIDLIDNIIEKYNNRYHLSISMTPNEAEQNFWGAIFNNKYLNQTKDKKKKFVQSFYKDDCVRVRSHFPGEKFKKGSFRHFSAEIFYVNSILKTDTHAIYKLRNEKGEIMKGVYDDNDLVKAKSQELYNVIILNERKRNKKDEVLIEYDGFPDYGKQWIDRNELVNL